MKVVDVAFPGDDWSCAGWLYYPTDTVGDVPCVVMAHGFSLTRHDGLRLYAEEFVRAGFAVLVYDHRFIGDSEGGPRQRICLSDQLVDRRRAVAFARTLDGIDGDRIILWGYSLSAVSAIDTAAADPGIAGLILLCPMLDSPWRVNRDLVAEPRSTLWLLGQTIRGTLRADVKVPVTNQPGGRGVLTRPGERDGFGAAVSRESPWRDEAQAGPMLSVALCRRVNRARKLHCPMLLQAAERDVSVSPRAIDQLARRGRDVVLKRYDADHFQPFYDSCAARIVADQVAWLWALTA